MRLGHTELPMSVEKESRRESPAIGKALSQGGREGRQCPRSAFSFTDWHSGRYPPDKQSGNKACNYLYKTELG